MDLIKLGEDETVVINPLCVSEPVIRVVITEATTSIAQTLMYRIVCGEAFGPDQPVFLSLHDSQEFAAFLESSMIEVTACAPNLLDGIVFSIDPSVAFKDADVVFSIGRSRGYTFTRQEYTDTFFEESIALAKAQGEAINLYAKRDVKVIVLGNSAARVIWEHAQSIPTENFTVVTNLTETRTAAYIAEKAKLHARDVMQLIIWGSCGRDNYPDCRYARFRDNGSVSEAIGNMTWIKKDLVDAVHNGINKCWYTKSTAYAMAKHCKALWCGTPEGEWISMGVFSDTSYEIPYGIFFSFPVYCKNGNYEIVQGLSVDGFAKRRLKELARLIQEETNAALKFCCACPADL